MHAVCLIAGIQLALLAGDHGSVVVHVFESVLVGIAANASIEAGNLVGSVLHFGAPAEAVGRQHTRENDLDAVSLSQRGHGDDVLVGAALGIGMVVDGDVIRAGVDDHGCGLQVDDILREAKQHLVAGLSADATADVAIVSEELRVLVDPSFGDGITHEDHTLAIVGFGSQTFVVCFEATEVTKILLSSHGSCRGKDEQHQSE